MPKAAVRNSHHSDSKGNQPNPGRLEFTPLYGENSSKIPDFFNHFDRDHHQFPPSKKKMVAKINLGWIFRHEVLIRFLKMSLWCFHLSTMRKKVQNMTVFGVVAKGNSSSSFNKSYRYPLLYLLLQVFSYRYLHPQPAPNPRKSTFLVVFDQDRAGVPFQIFPHLPDGPPLGHTIWVPLPCLSGPPLPRCPRSPASCGMQWRPSNWARLQLGLKGPWGQAFPKCDTRRVLVNSRPPTAYGDVHSFRLMWYQVIQARGRFAEIKMWASMANLGWTKSFEKWVKNS